MALVALLERVMLRVELAHGQQSALQLGIGARERIPRRHLHVATRTASSSRRSRRSVIAGRARVPPRAD